MKFAVMGDSSLGAPDAGQNAATCNIPQLNRTVLDMAGLSPRADLVLNLGDLVLNMAEDEGQALSAQLNAWQAAFRSIGGSSSLNHVPITGNHESTAYAPALGAAYPNPYTYAVWRTWIASNHYDGYAGNGPTPARDPQDFLVEDERNFSYSFTVKGVCFIIVNTDTLTSIVDPATSKPYAAWIPLHWVEGELFQAQASPSVSHIFVVGHRPLEAPSWTTPAGATPVLDNAEYPLATSLENAMKACSKVRAYLCSHVHAQDMTRLNGAPAVWQIVSGNAGAPLNSSWSPPVGPSFGFMTISIYEGGGVRAANYWRPAPVLPQLYYQDTPVPPPAAVPEAEIVIN